MAEPQEKPEQQRQHVDAAMAKHVVRKIDRFIIPVLVITYMFNFMDHLVQCLCLWPRRGQREFSLYVQQYLKHITDGWQNLQGQQYSWVASMFYFGYFARTYPTSILIARVPVAKYLTVNALFWGTVVAVTAACTNFGGLLVVRFLLCIAGATLEVATQIPNGGTQNFANLVIRSFGFTSL
ncbi:hypothetical protein ACHAQH_009554 [Verticillium albo-atrum]